MFLTSGSAAIHKFLLPTNGDNADDEEDQVVIYNDDVDHLDLEVRR